MNDKTTVPCPGPCRSRRFAGLALRAFLGTFGLLSAAWGATQPGNGVPPGIPGPVHASRVAPRDYYGDLRFRPSPGRDQEVVAGNCLNQRIKISVSPSFGVSWLIRESGRVSHWRGAIDPATGAVSVDRAGVLVFDNDARPMVAPEPAEADGDFARFHIRFGPCGEGIVTVRN